MVHITTSISLEHVDRVTRRIARLHASPPIAQRILALTRSSDFDMESVVKCLERDPALAARILRVVNSSRYGLAHHVTSIRHAATYLGQRSLRLFAVTFALVETLTHGSMQRIYSDYWLRSLAMSSVAAQLSRIDGDIPEDDAYAAGLLADLGVLVLAQFERELYRPICETNRHGFRLVAAEREVFGFDHALLGGRLLQNWQIPDNIVRAIIEHHPETADGMTEIELSDDGLTEVVQLANVAADVLIDADPVRIGVLRRSLAERFDLNDRELLQLLQNTLADVNASVETFGCRGNSLSEQTLELLESQINEITSVTTTV